MKRQAQKPKRISEPNECAALLRRRNNLEDAIRRDRIEIAKFDAQIHQLEMQRADIRAVDRSPDPVIPGIDFRKPGLRPTINPWIWGMEQGTEIVTSLDSQNDAREQIAILNRRIDELRYERNQRQRLLDDSIAGKARILEDMRRQGCPGAGTTNY
jgi:hypothetical protein